MIKRVLLPIVFLFVCAGLLVPQAGRADDTVSVYFFYSDSCPHCAKEEVFLDELEQEYGEQVVINRYEVVKDETSQELFRGFAAVSSQPITGVPATFIGDQVIVGFGTAGTTGEQITTVIDRCLAGACPDVGSELIASLESELEPDPQSEPAPAFDNALVVDLPLFGETDLSDYSLFGLTAVVAAIDGFNPCAMWVLLILIGMLLGMQNRRRMWLLGISFIVASAFVYFIFLAAWLEFFKFIGVVRLVQVIIGLVAAGAGVYYIRRFWKSRPGQCEVTNPEQRRKISERIKKIVQENALWIALPSIIGLAFVVNLIELACSAGLPAIYTQVLSLSDLSRLQYYGYLLLYVLIFMLDDLFVFIIAMITLKVTGTTGKYSRYATLVGGLVIILMGLLLLFKPEWLSFG